MGEAITRHSPRPLFSEGEPTAQLGRHARREAER